MTSSPSKTPALLTGWILFCAFCSWTGWLLSAVHELTVAGYLVAFGLGLAAASLRWYRAGAPSLRIARWPKLHRRFGRLCPLVFLVFTGLTTLAWALSTPNYYDALSYRLPRIMHWLTEGHWHWIESGYNRVNTRGCATEWVMAPMLALTRSDRLLFLLSSISFGLLPGVLYGVFTRLGVAKRVAYSWMWLLPLGCCFLLQAGTLGNDIFSALFAPAAVDYGLRARESGRVQQVWMAMLAAALATGVKANVLPLMLVWAVVLALSWRLVWHRMLASLAVGVLALGCSFLPTAALNYKYGGGDWTGGKIERFKYQSRTPWARLVGNCGMVLVYNLNPPLAPFAGYWNARIAPHLAPEKLRQAFDDNFGWDGVLFTLEEIPTDHSGLGLGVCALLGLSALVAARAGGKRPKPGTRQLLNPQLFILAAAGVAALAFLKAAFVKDSVRLLCAYYPLLVIPVLLLRGQSRVVRTRGWRLGVLACAVVSAVPLLVRPERPLVPVRLLLEGANHMGWGTRFIARAERVYAIYGERGDAFAPLLEVLPADASVVGAVTYDDPQSGLWKPFGQRRIVQVSPEASREELCARGVRYVLVSEHGWRLIFFDTPFEDWLKKMNGEVVRTVPLSLRAAEPPDPWHLVKLR